MLAVLYTGFLIWIRLLSTQTSSALASLIWVTDVEGKQLEAVLLPSSVCSITQRGRTYLLESDLITLYVFLTINLIWRKYSC